MHHTITFRSGGACCESPFRVKNYSGLKRMLGDGPLFSSLATSSQPLATSHNQLLYWSAATLCDTTPSPTLYLGVGLSLNT